MPAMASMSLVDFCPARVPRSQFILKSFPIATLPETSGATVSVQRF